uniref:Large ribosomal subunit protein bL32c n=3 Tax=Deschampsia TaxID=15452 RepID=A0A3T0U4W0_DESCE|nr:ribosomal protein L32 [Deschampsia antarctica]YP_009560082.1 ribosomal protein L32 [Deschampsia cespitosa]YP_010891022.1 ribosomal protein L32 [Deschampsia nubigena]AHI43093.1 ribosomal protein L32 [Deschampsia antarctica]AZZ70961.1 ribosomal protein L32 [Deschampsia cespitosa]UUC05498.1 ribosomal protein L32 [Deschampsia cespitosa]WJK72472.1 ribosomal protein L32 [Deschampsia nubigena]
MAVPKKRTSMSKKRIRKNIWKKKTYFSIVHAYSLAKSKSFSSGNEQHPKPKGFSGQQTNK